MRQPFPVLLAACALLAVYSCTPEGGAEDRAAISIRTTYLTAGSGSTWITVDAEGSWTISLSYGGEDGWAVVNPSSGTGPRADVRFNYSANEGEESRSVSVILKSGSATSSVSVTQEGSGAGTLPGPSGTGCDVAPFKWLELPATQTGDGLKFYSRDMEGRRYSSQAANGTRNWSNYWDATEKLSLWVAYPLNRSLIGNGSRSNAWGLDPQIPASEQPDITSGSYGGGWTRGHQIPSADRLSYLPNVTTFYGTNMTPQQYDFNGEIWASLEGKVRSYASSADTLYVVTGCLYEDSNVYTDNNSGFYVKVPTHYFKALLFYGRSTYNVAGDYMAAGFLLPHDESIRKDSPLGYIMSIDELEERTGIDFFPNLVEVLDASGAAAVESTAPSNWWK